MTQMIRDTTNAPIPVMLYALNKGQHLTANATSSIISNAIVMPTRVVALVSNVAAYFEVGDSSVTANSAVSHYLAPNVPILVGVRTGFNVDSSNVHIAAIAETGSAKVHISELR